MSYAPGDTFREIFCTQNPTTQTAADADSTPTATVRHNGTDDGTVTPTVTHVATGIYEVSFAIPAGYAARDNMNVRAQAVVGGKTGNVPVWGGLLGNAILQTANNATALATITGKLPSGSIGDATAANQATIIGDIGNLGSPQQANTAVTLPSVAPTNWIAATSIAAAALNGKGDWAKDGDAMSLTTAERTAIANALLDLADAIETGITPRTAIKGIVAALFGLTSSSGQNPEVYKNPAGTATRLSVANDSSGNRTAVTLTP